MANQEAGVSGGAGAPTDQKASHQDPLGADEEAEGAYPNEGDDDCNQRLPEDEGGPHL